MDNHDQYPRNFLATPPSPESIDHLLQEVIQELETGNFDPTTARLRQLVEALGDQRGMVRLNLVETLGKIGSSATPWLLEALAHHPNPVVRRCAGKALAQIRDPQGIAALIQTLLYDPDQVSQSSAAGALAVMGKEAIPALLEVMTGEGSECAKGHASWAIAFIGVEAKAELYAAFNSPHKDVRTAILGAVSQFPPQHFDQSLQALLSAGIQDEMPQVRIATIKALGNFDPQFAVLELVKLLDDPIEDVQTKAKLTLQNVRQDNPNL